MTMVLERTKFLNTLNNAVTTPAARKELEVFTARASFMAIPSWKEQEGIAMNEAIDALGYTMPAPRMHNALVFSPAWEIADGIREKRFSVREVIAAHLERA